MPLPEKVIEQLGREPTTGTQGWAVGALLFSGGIFFLSLVIYLGLAFGYEPYLQGQLKSTQTQLAALDNSISTGDQTRLIDFYSQISNLQALLKNHELDSQFFSWLETNTEANVYYKTFSLATGNRITLTGSATAEADVNQQVAIFENSPEVSSVSVSDVSAPQLLNGGWTFSISIVMNSSVFLASAK